MIESVITKTPIISYHSTSVIYTLHFISLLDLFEIEIICLKIRHAICIHTFSVMLIVKLSHSEVLGTYGLTLLYPLFVISIL